MRNEPPIDDPQALWQNQSTEEIRVPLEYFRRKAEDLRATARWKAVATSLVYLATLGFLAFQYTSLPNPIPSAGLVLLAAGCLYGAWRAYRQVWSMSEAPDLPAATGVAAYKRELRRSQEHARNAWKMSAPLIPGIVFTLPAFAPVLRKALQNPKVLLNALPFCVLLAVWLVPPTIALAAKL